MHLLEFNPETKTIVEISIDSTERKPGCEYFQVEGKRLEIPYIGPHGFKFLVWQHPDWEPPAA